MLEKAAPEFAAGLLMARREGRPSLLLAHSRRTKREAELAAGLLQVLGEGDLGRCWLTPGAQRGRTANAQLAFLFERKTESPYCSDRLPQSGRGRTFRQQAEISQRCVKPVANTVGLREGLTGNQCLSALP